MTTVQIVAVLLGGLLSGVVVSLLVWALSNECSKQKELSAADHDETHKVMLYAFAELVPKINNADLWKRVRHVQNHRSEYTYLETKSKTI